MAVMVAPLTARGQAIERNLPPPGTGTAPGTPPLPPPPAETDDRPLGPALNGIDVVSPRGGSEFLKSEHVAIDKSLGIGGAGEFHDLERFIGKPLSRKLIAEVEASIISRYRRLGRPLVTVTPPEQDVTSGVLRLAVVEFAAGKVLVSGTPQAGDIVGRVRFGEGRPPDIRDLSEDIEWLNRDPFRTVTPAFRPGAEFGRTDLSLDVQRRRSLAAYAGVTDGGPTATGSARYFAGAVIGDAFLPGGLLSAQVTGSAEAFIHDGRPFADGHPRYRSLAARYTISLAPRFAIESVADWLNTSVSRAPFTSGREIIEGAAGFRFALSNFNPALHGQGDARLGVELRRTESKTYFSGEEVFSSNFNIYQVYIGYAFNRALGSGSIQGDVTFHATPANFDRASGDARAQVDSSGRMVRARYAYLNVSIGWNGRLANALVLSSQTTAQLATDALPATEQFAIGGDTAARAFTTDDGAFDNGIVLRNEARWARCISKGAVCLQPLIFSDVAFARNARGGTSRAIDAGFGGEASIGPNVTASALAGMPFDRADHTQSGRWRVLFRLLVRV